MLVVCFAPDVDPDGCLVLGCFVFVACYIGFVRIFAHIITLVLFVVSGWGGGVRVCDCLFVS